MVSKDLDHWVNWACSHEAVPHPLGTKQSEVMPRPARPVSTQSVPSSDAVDTDEECIIAHVLCDHALLLHEHTHQQGATMSAQSRWLFFFSFLDICGCGKLP